MSNKQFKHIIIIGGQRCGTTFLLNLLKTSKQFLLTNKIFPEPKYFLQNNPSYINYLKNFFKIEEFKNERVLVEKSTTYYENYNSLKNINLILDKYYLVLILRDPIKRAISNYAMSFKNGFETMELNQAFSRELNNERSTSINYISTDPQDYIGRSMYMKNIKNILEIIPKDRLIVKTSESIFKNPKIIFEVLQKKGYFDLKNGIDEKSFSKISNEKINNLTYEFNSILDKDIYMELLNLFSQDKKYLIQNFNLDLSCWQ